MMSLTLPTHFKFKKPPNPNSNSNPHHQFPLQSHVETFTVRLIKNHPSHVCLDRVQGSIRRPFRTRVFSDDGGAVDATPHQFSEIEALSFTSSLSGDASLALFVQMLGLDRDPSEREQAVVTLRDYSLGGKKYIDDIMKYHGSLNLIVNLLKSDSRATLEAAAGLLRVISSINVYRDMVAESGAIEEIGCLLRRSSLASYVKEESISTLWNLSVDEKLQIKIANSNLLPLLIEFLEDKSIGVMEAVGGVLANLTLSQCNHAIMVEAGVIPKLAELLKTDVAGFKVIKKEAKNALLELAKDEYYKILVMEEGFVFVPLIGAAAYESYRPVSSWPSLPDGTEIKQTSKAQSGFGASEVLLGLHVQDKNINVEEAKVNAMIHRTNQRYLARMGMIEVERQGTSQSELSSWSNRLTILPSMDGVARLVLILELDDESAIARAADAIADASISEHMRVLFKDAGAVKNLVQLMDHHSDSVKLAVIRALERLSVSNDVCEIIEAEGVLYPLIKSLEKSDISESSINMILDILSRLLDPSKELKSRLHNGPDKTTRNAVSVGGENETPVSKSSSLKTVHEGELLDTSFLSCLVEILKTSSPILQRKAASILEFITVNESCLEKIISANIESGLDAVFRQTVLNGNLEMESETDFQRPELLALQIEEAGLAISASSRLLTRLLDSEQLQRTINLSHFTKLLRNILISSIPLHNKDWVAACLVKLSSLSAANNLGGDNPINMEVTLYETIPRLIEQISNSLSPQLQEDAVVDLNRIISEGAVDSTRVVSAEGGIFPLVKLIQEGNERAVEAGLAILHNLSMDSENHAAIIAAGGVAGVEENSAIRKSKAMGSSSSFAEDITHMKEECNILVW